MIPCVTAFGHGRRVSTPYSETVPLWGWIMLSVGVFGVSLAPLCGDHRVVDVEPIHDEAHPVRHHSPVDVKTPRVSDPGGASQAVSLLGDDVSTVYPTRPLQATRGNPHWRSGPVADTFPPRERSCCACGGTRTRKTWGSPASKAGAFTSFATHATADFGCLRGWGTVSKAGRPIPSVHHGIVIPASPRVRKNAVLPPREKDTRLTDAVCDRRGTVPPGAARAVMTYRGCCSSHRRTRAATGPGTGLTPAHHWLTAGAVTPIRRAASDCESLLGERSRQREP